MSFQTDVAPAICHRPNLLYPLNGSPVSPPSGLWAVVTPEEAVTAIGGLKCAKKVPPTLCVCVCVCVCVLCAKDAVVSDPG